MPDFFSFIQGTETNPRFSAADTSPLLGRFRAVPPPHAASASALPGWRGSVHVGYGALLARELDDESDSSGSSFDDDDGGGGGGFSSDGDDVGGGGGVRVGVVGGGRYRRGRRGGPAAAAALPLLLSAHHRLRRLGRRAVRRSRDLWVTPKQGAVRKAVDPWWSRWTLLVVLPAVLAVAWCALPFPQYPLSDDDREPGQPQQPPGKNGHKVPGHGEARVQVNFWFFLFVYYGLYNLTALIWITKVFNLYSLNWWPKSLGFPITVSAIAVLSLAAPIPIYLIPETKFLTVHNTAWITWTFVIMAMPVAIAFVILMTNERHLGLRHSLSETQRIFTSSWWTGEPDTMPRRERRRAGIRREAFDPDAALQVSDFANPSVPVGMRRRWLPASFVRFIWFCLALFIGLLAYLFGETYAEIYLRTLPHNNLETIVYVYGWIVTVYLLDGLTGWILGGNEGERVGSYPLSWVFKLYFMLTYQTYVRALYARLRSPSQFILLQVLSSTSLIVVTPLLMSTPMHRLLSILSINNQSYGAYQKMCIRNVFIRFLAENCSMLAFLGSIVVLHFGANKDVYPYFAFDDDVDSGVGGGGAEAYTFALTFYASSITWACELAASFIVAGLIRWFYGVSVVTEGKLDLAVWPELLPTSVAVILHVLQNMLFSIIRLQFR